MYKLTGASEMNGVLVSHNDTITQLKGEKYCLLGCDAYQCFIETCSHRFQYP
jgi:hypothetical protein